MFRMESGWLLLWAVLSLQISVFKCCSNFMGLSGSLFKRIKQYISNNKFNFWNCRCENMEGKMDCSTFLLLRKLLRFLKLFGNIQRWREDELFKILLHFQKVVLHIHQNRGYTQITLAIMLVLLQPLLQMI